MRKLPETPVPGNGLLITKAEAEERPNFVEYQHSLLCSLTLPRSRQKERVYIRQAPGRILKLEAGDLFRRGKILPQPLPYGPYPRLAFIHICGEAIKSNSLTIELENSARAFMERIGIADGGNQYRLFRQQMNALAACRFWLGYTGPDGKDHTIETKPVYHFEAWATNDDENQPALWPSSLQLSTNFFDDLIKHAVPLSANALRALSGTALGLDYYSFFAYRLHVLERKLFLPWHVLRDQIGQEYANVKDFKKESRDVLKSVFKVYPSARVEVVNGGLSLEPSPAPVERRSVAVSRGLADEVKKQLPPPQADAPALLHPVRRLHPRTIEKFKSLYPGLDVYACEADFRYWVETQAPEPPRSFNAAFLGFAKTWAGQKY